MQLAPGAVHLWTIDLDAPVDVDVLSVEEHERAARYRFDGERMRFAHRRATMRRIFADYLGTTAERIAYVVDALGKPALRDAAITFSVSSRDAIAVLALGDRDALGVDVEVVHALPDLDDLIARYVPPAERAAFASLDRVARERRFYRQWTAIEATLKARGTGFAGAGDAPTFVEQAPHMYCFEPSARSVATLASYAPFDQIVVQTYRARTR